MILPAHRLLAAMMLACAAAPAGRAAAPPTPPCPPAVEAEPSAGPLPHLAAALKPGGTLDILAVGAGPSQIARAAQGGAAAPALHPNGFGSQLAHALEAAIHGLHVTVTLQGGGGLDAQRQVGIIADGLKARRHQLVFWQTGTVEAVNDEPPDDFYQALSDGVQAAADAGADLVLVEPQFSRFLEANANVAPYLSVMQAVSALPGVLLFHRYELMHDWADAGLIDLESAGPEDRPAVAEHLRGCLAAELARALLAAAVATAN